jgi:hypothetical protein
MAQPSQPPPYQPQGQDPSAAFIPTQGVVNPTVPAAAPGPGPYVQAGAVPYRPGPGQAGAVPYNQGTVPYNQGALASVAYNPGNPSQVNVVVS